MLTKIFGSSSRVKLIDYLVAHPWEEFSKTQLAEGAHITRPTVYKLLDKLILEKLVIKTKKVGNIQLYQTNRKSPIIKYISSLKGLLADMEVDRQEKKSINEQTNISEVELDELLGTDDNACRILKTKEVLNVLKVNK